MEQEATAAEGLGSDLVFTSEDRRASGGALETLVSLLQPCAPGRVKIKSAGPACARLVSRAPPQAFQVPLLRPSRLVSEVLCSLLFNLRGH